MPTLFAVYNLKKDQKIEDYDNYLSNTKIPGIRSAPWCTGFTTWKIDKVLAPAVSEPEGILPTEPPYQFVAKIEELGGASIHSKKSGVANLVYEDEENTIVNYNYELFDKNLTG